jgi:hypothetical protein
MMALHPSGLAQTITRGIGEQIVIRKLRATSKVTAAIGSALIITGGLLFLNSLGSGGGYFSAALIISGAALIVVAIVKAVIKAAR